MEWDSKKEDELRELRSKELDRQERVDRRISLIMFMVFIAMISLAAKEVFDIITNLI